jgi:hypothetical protein
MSENNTITGANPTITQFDPPTPTSGGNLTNPPATPLQSQNRHVRAAWQAALRTIRKKNVAAQSNGGQRVPLT